MAKILYPRGYQKTAVQWALERPRSALFMDMGLGKTVVVLTCVNYLTYGTKEVKKTLVVAPKRVTESVWEAEALAWEHTKHLRFSLVAGDVKKRKKALEADADIYLTSRDNIAWLCGLYGGNMLPFDMLVIDESSSFKNRKSGRFKALEKACANTPRIVELTGTPAPNGLENLWSQLFLLDRGERLGRTLTEYRNEYFNKGQQLAEHVHKMYIRKGASDVILNKISDICLSMQSKDFLELPECVMNYIPVGLPPDVAEAYDTFKKHSVLQIMADKEVEVQQAREIAESLGQSFDPMSVYVTALTAAALSNKCLQYANGAVYYNDKKDWIKVHDEKIEQLLEIVDTLDSQNMLLAYNYKHDKERIIEAFKKNKINYRELKTDKDVKDWNAGKIKVLLAHPQSAGHGLNLQYGGSCACWFGLTWDLEVYEQFNKRLHRSGQTMPVIIHHLIAKGTEDERVIKRLQEKGDVQGALLDGLYESLLKYAA